MQIEEKQIVINGQNIILRSPKKQDAETFFQRCVTALTVKRIFWRDTRRRQILQRKRQRR